MNNTNFKIEFKDENLKEIFSLFSSCTEFEEQQIYDKTNDHFYLKTNLSDEYNMNEEKREYAIDSIRAVFKFLKKNDFKIFKNEFECSFEYTISK